MDNYYDSAEGVMINRAECLTVLKLHSVVADADFEAWFRENTVKRIEKTTDWCDLLHFEVDAQALLIWLGH